MVASMRKMILGLAALAATALPANAADRRFPITDFDRIVVEGPYVVRVVTGRTTSAMAEGTTAALDRLSLDVNGQTLRIRRTSGAVGWTTRSSAQEGTPVIEVTTRNLRSVRLIGPANVEIDRVQGLRVDLVVQGSGRLRVQEAAADNLSIGLAGSGIIELDGEVESLTADIQGTGNVAASGLTAENASVTAVTNGTVALNVTRAANVTALGLGQVTITGPAACNIRGANASLVSCGSGAAR